MSIAHVSYVLLVVEKHGQLRLLGSYAWLLTCGDVSTRNGHEALWVAHKSETSMHVSISDPEPWQRCICCSFLQQELMPPAVLLSVIATFASAAVLKAYGMQVRSKLVPAKRRAEAGQGTTWRALAQEDLKARLAASSVRRKAMSHTMPKDQWDLEKKYGLMHLPSQFA